jgi:SpoVK/Ycf46/Vps4 family AAA+-type ATPase
LLRRGRFDEIFFLDLPNKSERAEIFAVHLRKKKRDVSKFDLNLLVENTNGFVGAEIEQSIIDALYISFNAAREVTTEDILQACRRTIPLSISQEERINFLRSWLTEGRATSASVPDEQEESK